MIGVLIVGRNKRYGSIFLSSFSRGSYKKGKLKFPVPPFFKIGHRGSAGYCPENTIASFDHAIELGAEFLELDINLTKDGKLAVIHDSTVNRTTNAKGKISDFTMNELKNLDAGSWFHSRFAGESIPELQDVLERYSGKAGLLIEIKKPYQYPGIIEVLSEQFKGYTTDRCRFIVQSFDRQAIQHFHSLCPSIPVGVLIKNSVRGITETELMEISQYASYVNPKITMVNRYLADIIHSLGMKMLVWNINNKREAIKMNLLNADGIISDFPDLL
nr:glycerophosphodiester phosphodiesterase family protein [Neobacillus terrae]